MPLTRYERGVIEDLINRVVDQEKAITILQDEVVKLNLSVEKIGGGNVLSLSTEELSDAIEESVKSIVKKIPVKRHNHLSSQEGGDAFAKKGATLISDDPTEN